MDHHKSKSKSQTRVNNASHSKSAGKGKKKNQKISQKKSSNVGNHSTKYKQNYVINPKCPVTNIKDLVSPKTIEYSKVMEKYGDIIAENSPKENPMKNFYSNNNNFIINRNDQMNTDNSGRANPGAADLPVSTNKVKEDNKEIHSVREPVAQPSSRLNKFTSIAEYEKSIAQTSKKVEMENSGFYTGKYSLNCENCPREENESCKTKQISRENEQLKEENLNLKRMLEKEKSKNCRLEEDMKRGMNRNMLNMNIVEVKELEQLKEYLNKNLMSKYFRKINLVEKENEDIRANSKDYITKTQEKLALFIKLSRKYAKKLKNLIHLLNKLDTGISQSNIMHEFTQTVDQFYQTTYNPKLIFVLLENGNTKIDINTQRFLEEIETQSNEDHHNSNLFATVENFQKKMQEQNEFLVKKLEEESNEKAYLNEELNKIKRKFNDEKLHREEIESSLNYVKQLNKDLESKMRILEDENTALKKNMKNANDRIAESELVKNKNINLENDLKYRESIINYLESLLKNAKVTPSLYDENKYHENYEENKFSTPEKNYEDIQADFYTTGKISMKNPNEPQDYRNLDHRISFNPEKKPQISSNDECITNAKDRDMREKEKEDSFSSGQNEFRIKKSSRLDFHNPPVAGLKVEIDALDGEIKQLQSKLKVMIDVNKK